MTDFLFSIDKWLFSVINQTLQNGFFDAVMPFLTDLNQMLGGKIFFLIIGILLLAVGGRRGRILVLVLIITITISDQFSSSVIKPFFDRQRPCYVLKTVHLLVACGSGKSFPSSHAVNMFAVAVVCSYFYRRWRWVFFSFAATIAYSRVYVGVHYPSDAAGGALIGSLIGLGMVFLVKYAVKYFPLDKKEIAEEISAAEHKE
jgi:membrane-associated phospholipid phosphatase